MHKIFEIPSVDGSFHLADGKNCQQALKETGNHLKFFWNYGGIPMKLMLDQQRLTLEPSHMLSCTYLQKIEVLHEQVNPEVLILAFNRGFYCIHTNDSEVSCNGFLFLVPITVL